MTEKPSALIVSSSNTRPKSLIKLLTKCGDITEDPSNPNRISHPWIIDTKYYKAEVDIIGINENYERSDEFNESVEALIIHMDSNKETGLEDLSTWSSLEEDCNPEIKLLLTNYCTEDTKITKLKATEWCLERGFELIELYPSVNTEHTDKDIIEEKVGVDRVIEALQAHTWSNLVLKDEENKHLEQEQLADLCEELLVGESADDFTDLFAQLSMMKDSFQSLPMGQRKQCAEQVVTAFWRAIGGDEEEVADL